MLPQRAVELTHRIDPLTGPVTMLVTYPCGPLVRCNASFVTLPPEPDGEETELVITKRAYERKFFSDETNLSFVRCFLDHAKRDPISGEVGKTICFAVSRNHARKLVQLLNEEATKRWPEGIEEADFIARVLERSGAGRLAAGDPHRCIDCSRS